VPRPRDTDLAPDERIDGAPRSGGAPDRRFDRAAALIARCCFAGVERSARLVRQQLGPDRAGRLLQRRGDSAAWRLR